MEKYGKDSPDRFISGALTGGSGESNGIYSQKISRKDQSINSAYPMDNVGKIAGPHLPDERGGSFAGGIENLKHSLSGASAVEDVGASGKLKHVIIPNH